MMGQCRRRILILYGGGGGEVTLGEYDNIMYGSNILYNNVYAGLVLYTYASSTLIIVGIEVIEEFRNLGICKQAVTQLLSDYYIKEVCVKSIMTIDSLKCFRSALKSVYPSGIGTYLSILLDNVNDENFQQLGDIEFKT